MLEGELTLEDLVEKLEPKPKTERFLARNIPRSRVVKRSFPSFRMTYTLDLFSRGDALVGGRLLDFYQTRQLRKVQLSFCRFGP